MRDWANLDDPDVNRFEHRTDRRLLMATLNDQEQVVVVASASDRPFSRGLLAATTHRVLFVRNRVFAKPVINSFDYKAIDDVEIADHINTGRLTLQASDHGAVFKGISPKERLWPLYWRISERVGQLPAKGHS